MILFCFLTFISITVSLRSDSQYFKSVSGSVSAGNYTYYTLLAEGPVSLVLHTSKGDADLYISQKHVTPTYEPQDYCLHSATCGIDQVDIPSDFGRPIGIGIYGHPSHEESFYILELNLKTEKSFDDLNIGSFEENSEESERNDNSEEEQPNFLLILSTLFDLFLEIFLL